MTEQYRKIPTRPGMGRGLINHDERSKNYRAVALLTDEQQPVTRHWRRSWAYDQGNTPECVAYCGKGMMNSRPVSAFVPYHQRAEYEPHQWYVEARRRDEWAGEDYEGTSALGLCRWLKEAGIITEYRWCFGIQDVLRTVSHVGPVGIGVMWTDDMFEPDNDGFIHATGSVVGGHEIEVTGIDVVEECVVLTNSWGLKWGDRGRAKLKYEDLDALLTNDGDAFVVLR